MDETGHGSIICPLTNNMIERLLIRHKESFMATA